jgi:GT2 family glycosyltransferase
MQLIDDSLVDMYTFFIRQPHIAAIGPMFLNPDRTPQPSVFPPQTLTNAFKEYWLNLPAFSKYLPPSSKPQPVYCISGGAFLIKRSDFESAGRWDEKYFFYYEDLDLCRRLYNLKRQIYFYPSCQIIHHHGLSGQKLASPQTQWKRLIPGSIIFHGHFIHYLLFAIIRTSQIFKKL